VLQETFLQKLKSLKYVATKTVVFVASLLDMAVNILLLSGRDDAVKGSLWIYKLRYRDEKRRNLFKVMKQYDN
jgi:hypothetical protein